MKESEFCSKVIETAFNKPFVLTKNDNEDLKNSSEYWICKKAYEEGEVKVKYHDHITGKY